MRRAALVLAASLAAVAVTVVARADEPQRPPSAAPDGFDHNIHLSRVAAAGADAIACERCHAWRPAPANVLAGRPDHAACFTGCHGGAPAAPAIGARLALTPERLRVCVACHAEAVLAKPYAGPAPFAVAYPPYRKFPDHALQIGHKTHRAVACVACHDEKRGAPHRRCAGCHDGAAGHGPPMTACARCHAPASGAPDPPQLVMTKDIEIVTKSAFSHAKHAARGGAGRQCTACHAAIAETDERQLPRPTAADCATAGCHDGAAAFPPTAACTRCHQDVPKARFEVARPDKRFSHATAAHRGAQLPCATCHPLAKSGEVLVAGHAPCAACHADDFGKRRPTICGACHNATEPWRALKPDRLPPDHTEFGATLDHGKHPGACTVCHSLAAAGAQLRPPRGHRACTGAACHAVGGGPAPAMSACEGCHEEGRAAAREGARLLAPWSVRAAFDHATHRRSKDGALRCEACHADLAGPDVKALKTPPKAACAGCHDGAAAFKLTGTTCTKCHRRASSGR
jgi:c(7)-type cytochrome triheme protein